MCAKSGANREFFYSLNNPVQILLNAQDFVRAADTNPGGSNKDFFANRDAEFATHRQQLERQIAALGNGRVTAPNDNGAFYARVELQSNAWAKSHRPLTKMFPTAQNPHLSGTSLGTMVVEMVPEDLPRIINTIRQAEAIVTKRDKQGKLVPSRTRSEVGAINSVRVYGAEDRRKFSTAQAVRWLADPRTGGVYYVELFVQRNHIESRTEPHLRTRARNLIRSFETALGQCGLPIEWTLVERDWLPFALYTIKVAAAQREQIAVHDALLTLLEGQVVVKTILLPPVLQASDVGVHGGGTPALLAPAVDGSYPVLGIVDTGAANYEPLQAWSVGRSDFLDGVMQDQSHGTFIAGLASCADQLNPGGLYKEHPCRFYDLGLHANNPVEYQNYYPRGFLDFLEQLDAELPAARAAGVRVINMSLAVAVPIADEGYSVFANILDALADRHNILFVLPAGNLEGALVRDPCPVASTCCRDSRKCCWSRRCGHQPHPMRLRACYVALAKSDSPGL